MTLVLDHLVVAAVNLEQGVAYVEKQLDVKMSKGGQHIFMGTHNALLRLGTDSYLEVIAIDQSLPAPSRPRWFGLDDLTVREKFRQGPRLIHWVAGTRDIIATHAKLPGVLGPIIAGSRGNLTWKISIPNDGSLPMDGAFPTLIEWPAGDHIASKMLDRGCEFLELIIQHPEANKVQEMAQMTNQHHFKYISGDTTRLKATIKTPNGVKYLS